MGAASRARAKADSDPMWRPRSETKAASGLRRSLPCISPTARRASRLHERWPAAPLSTCPLRTITSSEIERRDETPPFPGEQKRGLAGACSDLANPRSRIGRAASVGRPPRRTAPSVTEQPCRPSSPHNSFRRRAVAEPNADPVAGGPLPTANDRLSASATLSWWCAGLDSRLVHVALGRRCSFRWREVLNRACGRGFP